MSDALKWNKVEELMPDEMEPVLFTNNIEARTAQNYMSHVWLGWITKRNGEIRGVISPGRHIDNVTHWLKIPMTEGEETCSTK